MPRPERPTGAPPGRCEGGTGEAARSNAESGLGPGGYEGVHLRKNATVPRREGRGCVSAGTGGLGTFSIKGQWKLVDGRRESGAVHSMGQVGNPQQ